MHDLANHAAHPTYSQPYSLYFSLITLLHVFTIGRFISQLVCSPQTYIIIRMPLLKDEAVSQPAKIYINLTRDEKLFKENIRVTSNHISILDDEGQIIEEIVPLGKILPTNLENEQISERSLINSLDNFVAGMNLTVLLVGASFSGKEKLFDGNKNELPLASYFVDRLFPALRQKYRRYELRMKMGLMVKEKIYDCNSQNKYGTLKIKESDWEGVEIVNMNAVAIQSPDDFKKEMQRAIKQKNRLVLEFKDLYTSYLSLTLIREPDASQNGKIISTATFIEVPGVQILAQSQNSVRSKEASLSTKSLLNFAAILNDLSKNPQTVIEYDSVLGLILKEILCGNSQLVCYFHLKSEDIQGSRGTIKFLKMAENLSQFPVINQGEVFGLLRRYRAQALARKGKQVDKEVEQHKNFLQNEIQRVKTEDDYARLLQKYSDLKNKYNASLKAKSEAQLQLIKCQQQKLQIGKSLVEVQIQNTKLLQKLQNKDYQNGKKVLQTENRLAKKEGSYQQSLDKIAELNTSLNDALQTKRDLEVEFIALKRNFILQQKDIKTLKEDNQNLSLDVINLSNENERLKQNFMSKTQPDQRSKIMLEMEAEKQQELKRQIKQQEETINYLKSEVERYKRELIEREVKFQKAGKESGLSGYGNNYDRIELQNQSAELQNKVKLLSRKIEELEEKVGFYEQQNNNLQNENKQLRNKANSDTNEYRKKLEQFAKNTNYEAILKELRENFAKKDNENITKYNNLKKTEHNKKQEITALKAHLRSLLALMEEWAPQGVDLPALRKFKQLDLKDDGEVDRLSELRVKNMKLEQQVRRLKVSGGNLQPSGIQIKPDQIRESRVKQQYNYLKNSQAGNSQANRIKDENARLMEQNRRLVMLVKDGNKMDLNVVKRESEAIRKEMDNLKKQNEYLRNQSSVSPSTADQKLVFYQKHLKLLEKQRSELLSRCTVAEQQVKNLLLKVGKSK